MSFSKMEDNVLNISGLDNKPKMSAAELKAMFDKAGLDIKNFINGFIDEIESINRSTQYWNYERNIRRSFRHFYTIIRHKNY